MASPAPLRSLGSASEPRAFARARTLFREAAQRVPAYRNFLKKHGIDAKKIRSREASGKIHLLEFGLNRSPLLLASRNESRHDFRSYISPRLRRHFWESAREDTVRKLLRAWYMACGFRALQFDEIGRRTR